MKKRSMFERLFWRWLWRKWKRRILSLEIDLSNERMKRMEAESRYAALIVDYQKTLIFNHLSESAKDADTVEAVYVCHGGCGKGTHDNRI